MSFRWFGQHFLIGLVLSAFVVFGLVRYASGNDSGDDLSSSFLGCRLLSEGSALQHLYASDPKDFSAIGPDDFWQEAADRGGFVSYMHPYVQTPLWAFLLEPTCERLNFSQFKTMFAVILLLSFALTLWLVARFWAPTFLHPLPLAVVAVALTASQPFQYAMFLMQTHILFVLATVAALILAERERPAMAGLLLAFAAAVKVTPMLMLLYWIIIRRWKAAAYMTGWFALLTAISLFAGGVPLYRIYLEQLGRLSHTLLLSQNNQSLAAWWMTRLYPFDEVQNIDILPLPAALSIISSLALFSCTLAGALLDRRRRMRQELDAGFTPPFGAVAAFLAATLFAPIAWTHYFIVLVIPVMLLWQVRRSLNTWLFWPTFALLILLNFPPLATDVIQGDIGHFAILRGQFFAGVLALVMMLVLAWRRASTAAAAPALG